MGQNYQNAVMFVSLFKLPRAAIYCFQSSLMVHAGVSRAVEDEEPVDL